MFDPLDLFEVRDFRKVCQANTIPVHELYSYEGVFNEYLHVKFEVNEVITILRFVKRNENYACNV